MALKVAAETLVKQVIQICYAEMLGSLCDEWDLLIANGTSSSFRVTTFGGNMLW